MLIYLHNPPSLLLLMNSSATTEHKNKKRNRHHMMYLFVGSAESKTNVVQARAVFRKVSNVSVKVGAPVKCCPSFLDLALASGPVCVCLRCKLRVKTRAATFFFCSHKGNKTRHYQKLPEWCLGKTLPSLWLSGGQGWSTSPIL